MSCRHCRPIRSSVVDVRGRHSLRSYRRITRTSYRRTDAKPTKMPGMRRLLLVTLAAVGVWTIGGLLLDRHVGQAGQFALGLLTVGVLAGLLALHPRIVRLQTLAVIVIATVGEVVGLIVWGLYTYRLENLPAFVPPGHGLVYLAGFARGAHVDRATSFSSLVVAAAVWGIAGVSVLPTPDASGTIGCAFLIGVLVLARRPVYAGVFMVVRCSSSTARRSDLDVAVRGAGPRSLPGKSAEWRRERLCRLRRPGARTRRASERRRGLRFSR